MATKRVKLDKKEKPEEDEELERLMYFPPQRSSILHNKTVHAVLAGAERFAIMRHEELWAKVKRAETRLSKSMTDVPPRNRALEHIYADLVAENAKILNSSLDTLREIESKTDSREIIRIMGEDVKRAKAFHEAKWRSVSLYLFAPLGDVGFFCQLGKLLGYSAHFPGIMIDKIKAFLASGALNVQERQLKTIAEVRSMKSAAEGKSNSRDASTKQYPARSSKGDSRRPRRK